MQQHPIPANEQEKRIIQKIRALSPEKVAEVADFVDFISLKDDERRIVKAAGQMATEVLSAVWNNPEDDIYDRL